VEARVWKHLKAIFWDVEKGLFFLEHLVLIEVGDKIHYLKKYYWEEYPGVAEEEGDIRS
jgi:hypothetical protein